MATRRDRTKPRVYCDQRRPPEKHRWIKAGWRPSGRYERQRWVCTKCGRSTTNEEVLKT